MLRTKAALASLLTVCAVAATMAGPRDGRAISPPPYGDFNCAAGVNALDALHILQYSAGLIAFPSCGEDGDTNADGRVDPIDANLVLQFVAQLVPGLGPSGSSLLRAATNGTADGSATVRLEAVGFPSPGIRGWNIDVVFDTSVLRAVDCRTIWNGVCNPQESYVRFVGANPEGISEPKALGTAFFICSGLGEAEVTLRINLLTDRTESPLEPLAATTQSTTIVCR